MWEMSIINSNVCINRLKMKKTRQINVTTMRAGGLSVAGSLLELESVNRYKMSGCGLSAAIYKIPLPFFTAITVKVHSHAYN